MLHRSKMVKDVGFKIKVKTNLTIVNVLDVNFIFLNGTYSPYKTCNDNLSYIHTFSNYPPQIIEKRYENQSVRDTWKTH